MSVHYASPAMERAARERPAGLLVGRGTPSVRSGSRGFLSGRTDVVGPKGRDTGVLSSPHENGVPARPPFQLPIAWR